MREPVSDELAREQPTLTSDIAEAMAERGLTPEQIAALAGWADPARNTLFVAMPRPLRAVR